jgi:aminoglycoside phosphotransferase (APT) family kinase protein
MSDQMRQVFSVNSLEQYLKEHLPFIGLPLDVKQFGFGQSNPTYQLTSPDGSCYVMRKKPSGKLLSQAAHKVESEYRILTALSQTNVPIPKTYCLCEDASVIGTPFYIMEFLDGRILEDPALPGIEPEERTVLWKEAVHNMARLHRVDFVQVGLGNYGKHEGFYDRQLRTWEQLNTVQSKTIDVETKKPVGSIPHNDEMIQFFSDKKRQPKERASLVHGDYKLDNVVFDMNSPAMIGILDWEMSTVCHPISDLANLVNPFYTLEIRPKYISDGFLPGITPGLPTADMVIDWYSEVAGWDPRPELEWAVAFSMFRGAALCQGIAARVATKQSTHQEARNYADAFLPLGNFAWKMVCQLRERHVASKL